MKKSKRLRKLYRFLISLILILTIVLGISGIVAKYRTTVSVTGNVSFSAELAESVTIFEHGVKRQEDGSYQLTDEIITGENQGNSYKVMPGVDIPKDPQIEIVGKRAIDSYLYVEVKDNLPDSIEEIVTYKLTDEWKKLNVTTGPSGNSKAPTSVYVYIGDSKSAKILDESFEEQNITILDKNIITVGEAYSETPFELEFYGYLVQIPQETTVDAESLFKEQLMPKENNLLNASNGLSKNASSSLLNSTLSEQETEESAEETPEYVTITIQYVDSETKTPVFDEYVATLQYGTEFTAEVSSPTRVGYAPYIENTSAETVKIPKQEYKENVTYTVEYKPIEVSYTVRHYVQNVSDDSYTEYTIVSGMLKTGTKPSTDDLSLKELTGDGTTAGGFDALYHEPDVVAADGSTEFHVYYDRKYFLYTFDCAGGYGVDPIYARYETPLAVPNPVRPGYTFTGWEILGDDGNYTKVDAIHSEVGLADVSYRATWTPSEDGTTYTVVYWQEAVDSAAEGEGKKYDYWGNETVTAKAEDKVSGSDRAPIIGLDDSRYFTYDDTLTEKNIEVKGDGSTVVNVYYSRNTYTLKFYYARSSVNDNGTLNYEVAGGSTWPFAWETSTDIATMLGRVGSWGSVKNLPELNDAGEAKGYAKGDETYNNQTYYYIQFQAQYGADISQIWPLDIFDPVETSQTNDFGDIAYFSAWNVEYHTYYSVKNTNKTLKGNYQRLDYQMLYDAQFEDADTIRFLAFWENGADNIGWNKPNKWTYEIYLPVLEGEDVDERYQGVDYKLEATYILYDNNTNQNPGEQTATAVEGFTHNADDSTARVAVWNEQLDSTYDINAYTMKFYYVRNEYTLEFSNLGKVVKTEEKVPFENPLGSYNFVPDYPANLESNAYYFAGWYTSPGCYDGTEVDWTTVTMPAGDLMLYAKWAPIERKVTFSNHYQDAMDGKHLDGFGGTVMHGQYLIETETKIPSVNDVSSEGIGNATNYVPIGWFYIDEVTGEKKRFNTGSMKVTRDLNLFMEWKSNKVVEYTVEYVVDNGDGTYTTIGEPTKGHSFAGLTRTFKAKVGTELKEGYQEKYYPMEASHSILMTENQENSHRFVYAYKEEIGFKVNYINQLTKLPMEQIDENPKVGTTSAAVITEKFVPVSDYMPDAYYKQLILSYTPEKNVINFYYIKDEEHAHYAVKHMVENVDGSYSEYATVTGIGDINKEITEQALTLGGYKYDVELTEKKIPVIDGEKAYSVSKDGVTGTITLNGLEMYIYYSRKPSGYVKRYVEYGTDRDLIGPFTVTGHYKDLIYIDIQQEDKAEIEANGTKYVLVSDPIYSSTMGIVNEDVNGNLQYPEIIFYYTAKQVTISYVPVCKTVTEGFGKVSLANERAATAEGLSGCTALPASGYQFAGWYSDEACTNMVQEDVYFKPEELPENDTTYYALFEPILEDLTIEKTGDTVDASDTFLFKVKGTAGAAETVDLTVSITGKGSVTVKNIPVGKYTVEELTEWSWRYSVNEWMKTVTVVEDGTNTVTFTNLKNSKAWLGGEQSRDNLFDAVVLTETP